ncbi:hypothetical protein HYT56_01670 [Candidatus Woesearchaeota archaeon]|nr:hypothetical protein [Candidatus Woesearchaeota archaeon]
MLTFKNNKIDLLQLVPKTTSSGFPIQIREFKKNNEIWLHLHYNHPRKPKLEIKRFIDIKKFGNLLGQYQAEGNKPINSIYPKYKVEFKNKIINEHEEFLNSLNELGINDILPALKVAFGNCSLRSQTGFPV